MPEIRCLTLKTPILNIVCELAGPENGRPLVLVHGWPDDPRTWDGMLPVFHAAGFQTISPYLRGFGPTRFRSASTMRSGQLSAPGRDLIDTVDALGIERRAVIGHDWGARAAYIAACVAPERFTHCIALSVGWGTNDPDQALSLKQVQNYWYHWYMSLPRGEALTRDDRRNFTRYIWQAWMSGRPPTEAEFEASASSFDNPDWADIVLHSYRVRWGLADVDPLYAPIEKRLKLDPVIRVPTLVIHGGADPCNAPETSERKEHLFTAMYRRVVLDGVGHFPQREAPAAAATQLASFLTTNAS